MNKLISCIEPLSTPFKTLDPFLFCVYHKDHYPPGDAKMQAPRRGNGADFNPSADYRMYHGDRIPGFPQHPHRGFETVTATIQGLVDHTDSMGNAGRYGNGDLQWMTAGKGIVHGEMFPLLNEDKPNIGKFFQIWLNLPKASKMVELAFVMHWAEDIPKFTADNGKVSGTVWAGELEGKSPLAPTPNSWASNPQSEVGIWYFVIQPGGTYNLPAAAGGKQVNRMAYFIEGQNLQISQQTIPKKSSAQLEADQAAVFHNADTAAACEVLVLQGRPIGEPVAQYGPFVMNTQTEIEQAFSDYRRTQFGGWPWPQDAMVFPRDKGRFALQKGVEQRPTSRAQIIQRSHSSLVHS